MVDRHSQATIYSHRLIGLGRDALKWEFRQSAVDASFGGRELRGNNCVYLHPPTMLFTPKKQRSGRCEPA